MASLPQKPKSSHVKKISVVTSRSVETGDVDNMRPAGRRKREMRKFGGGRSSSVELDPRPSDDVDDPLVRLLLLNEPLAPFGNWL
jgi:hypothetical protein